MPVVLIPALPKREFMYVLFCCVVGFAVLNFKMPICTQSSDIDVKGYLREEVIFFLRTVL